MVLKIIKDFVRHLINSIFSLKREVKLGFYGPPNGGKTTLANKICTDWIGEEIGTVSKVPHETRSVKVKEKVEIKYKGKKLTFKIADTPGITTKLDYEDFLKFGLPKPEAKRRAKEATKGVIESIKWLEDMDMIVLVLDATENPYNQVNVTIVGNIEARKIPLMIVANKMDMKKANLKKIQAAFPEYDVVGISAKEGKNLEEFYETLFSIVKKM